LELGLPRRDVPLSLKKRTEVPEPSNFVVVIQVREMRSTRRRPRREQARKLPVRLLLLLALTVSPNVFVITPGRAAARILDFFD
jgi:hypothetical protein